MRPSYAESVADDLAFLFNDPSRRSRPGARRAADLPPRPVPHEAPPLSADIDWMSLRQVHNQTSIPISTLRKWAKKGKVRARLVRAEGKELRLVAFGDVVGRARALDRPIEPVEVETVIDLRDPVDVNMGEPPSPPGAAPEAHIAPVATVESAPPAPEPVAIEEAPSEEAPTDESVLVPRHAWDRMLDQLGNLHEAGQQLADARERAAKAETESEFLKERVREMRKRMEEAELALDLQSEARSLPEVAPEPVLRIGWRRFRDRWLGS